MTREELERAVIQYQDRVYAVAFQSLRSSTDADDITQTVFLKLLKSDVNFASDDHIRHWLLRVAINECRRQFVSPWRIRNQNLEDYEATLAFCQPEESELYTAVMSLPKIYRLVIHLYYFEDYTAKEIASLLHITVTTVTTRLARARKILREMLKEGWDNE